MSITTPLLSALRELMYRANESLDYRPEFRAAISNAFSVIAQAEGEDTYREKCIERGMDALAEMERDE